MLRLLYMLLRQRLRRPGAAPAVPPARYPRRARRWILGSSALVLCAGIAGLAASSFLASHRARDGAAPASATLRIRVEAVASTPVVVFLEGTSAPVNPGAAPRAVPAHITSVNATFQPPFQVAPLGGRIDVSNEDAMPHNTHLFGSRGRTLFNVALPTPGRPVRKPLTRAGIFDVRCDLHPWMRAWVFVPPGAHHAVLWGPGEVTLEGIAPGRYRLHVWEPARGDAARVLTVATGDSIRIVH